MDNITEESHKEDEMKIDLFKTNGSSPPSKKNVQIRTKAALWNQYFPDVPLTDERWIERCGLDYLEEGLRITAEKDRQGRFSVRDQANIGKYLCGVVKRLQSDIGLNLTNDVITFPVSVRAGYIFTESDRQRFRACLSPDGDCLRWTKGLTEEGYGRFSINGRNQYAHIVGFFMQFGGLPVSGELNRQQLNVAHACRHRDCCNSKHLRMTSKVVNLGERDYLGEQDCQAQTLAVAQ